MSTVMTEAPPMDRAIYVEAAEDASQTVVRQVFWNKGQMREEREFFASLGEALEYARMLCEIEDTPES